MNTTANMWEVVCVKALKLLLLSCITLKYVAVSWQKCTLRALFSVCRQNLIMICPTNIIKGLAVYLSTLINKPPDICVQSLKAPAKLKISHSALYSWEADECSNLPPYSKCWELTRAHILWTMWKNKMIGEGGVTVLHLNCWKVAKCQL